MFLLDQIQYWKSTEEVSESYVTHKGHIPQSWKSVGPCFLNTGLSRRHKRLGFHRSVEFTGRLETDAEANAKEIVTQFRGLHMASM